MPRLTTSALLGACILIALARVLCGHAATDEPAQQRGRPGRVRGPAHGAAGNARRTWPPCPNRHRARATASTPTRSATPSRRSAGTRPVLAARAPTWSAMPPASASAATSARSSPPRTRSSAAATMVASSNACSAPMSISRPIASRRWTATRSWSACAAWAYGRPPAPPSCRVAARHGFVRPVDDAAPSHISCARPSVHPEGSNAAPIATVASPRADRRACLTTHGAGGGERHRVLSRQRHAGRRDRGPPQPRRRAHGLVPRRRRR
jgi:hypothetical protein